MLSSQHSLAAAARHCTKRAATHRAAFAVHAHQQRGISRRQWQHERAGEELEWQDTDVVEHVAGPRQRLGGSGPRAEDVRSSSTYLPEDRRRSKGLRDHRLHRSRPLAARTAKGAGPGSRALKATDVRSLVDKGRADDWDMDELCAAWRVVAMAQGLRDREWQHDTMARMRSALLGHVPRMRGPGTLASVLWCCATAGYWEDSELVRAVLQQLAVPRLLQRGNGADAANLWWAMSQAPVALRAQLADEARAALDCSAADIKQRLSAMDFVPASLSSVLLACAKLQYADEELLGALLDTFCSSLPAKKAGPADIVMALQALGELRQVRGYDPDEERLAELCEAAVDGSAVRCFDAQQLSTILCACNSLDSSSSSSPSSGRLLGAVLTEVQARFEKWPRTFNAHTLCHALWAYAKLDLDSSEQLQPLVAAARQQLLELPAALTEANLCSTLRACAALRPAQHALLQPLAAEALRRLRAAPPGASAFSGQDMSHLLLGLESLAAAAGAQQEGGVEEYRQLVAAVASECEQRTFSDFGPQDMASALWALAKMGVGEFQGCFAAAATAMLKGSAGANCHEWCTALWALARVQHYSPALLALAAKRLAPAGSDGRVCTDPLRDVSGLDCASALWACAKLAHYDKALVGALAQRLQELLLLPGLQQHGLLHGQQLCTGLWALAVLDAVSPGVLARHAGAVQGLLAEAERQVPGPSKIKHFTKLYQVGAELQAADARGPDGGALRLSPELAAAGRQAMRAAVRQQQSPSKLQREVHARLVGLQRQGRHGIMGVQEEELVDDPAAGLCALVDIRVQLAQPDGNTRAVVVEVDGATHFMCNEPHSHRKDGPTRLRDRQLARAVGVGNVVCVPYWEWQALRGKKARAQYLVAQLGLLPV